MYRHFFKRIFDFVISTITILLLIPLFILISLAVFLDNPGSVFFVQKRIARDRRGEIRYFRILKFRTMKTSTPRDIPTHLMTDPGKYLTRVGKFLRVTSLDELPQVFNIWLGQMSIVGPRPALWNQEDLYRERAKYGANAVRPGLTGWAQIHGRDTISIEEKAKLDGEYVKKLSLRMDLKCFFGSILPVLSAKDVARGEEQGETKASAPAGEELAPVPETATLTEPTPLPEKEEIKQ